MLLRQTTVPTVIDSFYLVTLGSYRAFYILNWILRAATEGFYDPIAIIFGIVQTAFYVDFAWVYWTRQRVKLRNGGVVDSEDLSRGWLVSRVLGKSHDGIDEEEANVQGRAQGETIKPGRARWGARGVSISADDQPSDGQTWKKKAPLGTSRFNDDDLERIVEEDADSESRRGLLPTRDRTKSMDNGISNGSEWRDESK